MRYDELREGMTVYGADGGKLGKVVEKRSDCFVIEKGLFFKKDHFADYGLVGQVLGDEVRLNQSGDALMEQPPSARAGGGEYREADRTASDASETRIPLAEEEEQEIRKRPVVREEIRATRSGYTEERRASEGVREETAEVEAEGQGDLPRRGEGPKPGEHQ
ncbi:MAG TPA: DUF2382 domain-containing protein [Myxococcales bacterium]|jgi:hypothetical protein